MASSMTLSVLYAASLALFHINVAHGKRVSQGETQTVVATHSAQIWKDSDDNVLKADGTGTDSLQEPINDALAIKLGEAMPEAENEAHDDAPRADKTATITPIPSTTTTFTEITMTTVTAQQLTTDPGLEAEIDDFPDGANVGNGGGASGVDSTISTFTTTITITPSPQELMKHAVLAKLSEEHATSTRDWHRPSSTTTRPQEAPPAPPAGNTSSTYQTYHGPGGPGVGGWFGRSPGQRSGAQCFALHASVLTLAMFY